MVEYVPQHALLLLFALMVTVAGIRTLVKSSQGEPEQMASPTRRAVIGATVGGGGFIVAPMLMELGYLSSPAWL